MRPSDTVWRIDGANRLYSTPPVELMSRRQFDEQDWPPCPVCGRIVDVDAIELPEFGRPHSSYMVGGWRCRNGCDPERDHQAARLTPAQYAEELQRLADRYWPGTGIEVHVRVWQRQELADRD